MVVVVVVVVVETSHCPKCTGYGDLEAVAGLRKSFELGDPSKSLDHAYDEGGSRSSGMVVTSNR